MKKAGICLLSVLLPLVLLCGCIRIVPREDTDTTDGSVAVTTAAVSETTADPVTTFPAETSVITFVETSVTTSVVTQTQTSAETVTEPEITTTELPAAFPNEGEPGFTKRY